MLFLVDDVEATMMVAKTKGGQQMDDILSSKVYTAIRNRLPIPTSHFLLQQTPCQKVDGTWLFAGEDGADVG